MRPSASNLNSVGSRRGPARVGRTGYAVDPESRCPGARRSRVDRKLEPAKAGPGRDCRRENMISFTHESAAMYIFEQRTLLRLEIILG